MGGGSVLVVIMFWGKGAHAVCISCPQVLERLHVICCMRIHKLAGCSWACGEKKDGGGGGVDLASGEVNWLCAIKVTIRRRRQSLCGINTIR